MVGLTIDMETLMALRKERLRSFEISEDHESLDEMVVEELIMLIVFMPG